MYALCAEFATTNKAVAVDSEQLQGDLVRRAIDALRSSVAVGWDDFERMKTDDNLKRLRSLQEFQALFPTK